VEVEYKYLLNQGDLRQMANHEKFLRQRGFNLGHVDVFPALATEEEYVCALRAIYNSCIDGWWNYQDQCVRYGICTDDEFRNKFTKIMNAKASRVNQTGGKIDVFKSN
jgi:hypothetical protein